MGVGRNVELDFLGGFPMFKGKAELKDPEKGCLVATFKETCHDDGSAAATVKLKTPITLKGTELLAIYGTVTSTPMIRVEASDPDGTEICEFQGKSAIDCIPKGGDISLVKSPGGPLGTLLVVLGKGTVHELK
jgi:hypothetical protein